MRYRQFLHKGKPTDRWDSTAGAEFGVSDAVGISEVAALLGVAAGEVTVAHSEAVPVSVEVVIPPTVGVEEKSKLEELLDAIASSKSLDEVKGAVARIRGR